MKMSVSQMAGMDWHGPAEVEGLINEAVREDAVCQGMCWYSERCKRTECPYYQDIQAKRRAVEAALTGRRVDWTREAKRVMQIPF